MTPSVRNATYLSVNGRRSFPLLGSKNDTIRSVSAASAATLLEIKNALTRLSSVKSADQYKSLPSKGISTSAFLTSSILACLCASESFLLTSSGVIGSLYGVSDVTSGVDVEAVVGSDGGVGGRVGIGVGGASGMGVMIAGLDVTGGDGTGGATVFEALKAGDEALSKLSGCDVPPSCSAIVACNQAKTAAIASTVPTNAIQRAVNL